MKLLNGARSIRSTRVREPLKCYYVRTKHVIICKHCVLCTKIVVLLSGLTI